MKGRYVPVFVTQDDIDKGCEIVPAHLFMSNRCVIARAVKRIFPYATSVVACLHIVIVDGTEYIIGGKAERLASLDDVSLNDIHATLKPFNFSMIQLSD